ncbi:MAG: sugar ABC transporter substrate-binding protein [Nodosilinea sp. LVE1205-7]
MKRRSWTGFILLALSGLVLSWLISCGGSSQPPRSEAPQGQGGAEVEFWTMQLQPQFTNYFNQLIAAYEGENPGIKIRWVDIPWADMQSKVLTAVTAGTAPDLVNLNPDFAAQLASKKAWLPLDGKVKETDKKLYLPKIWQANTLKGATFGLPWYLTTNITLYNQDLLKTAGVKPPTSFAELPAVARAVKEKTGKYAYFTSFVPQDAADVLQSFVQMGVELVNGEGKAGFNTPAGKAVFQYWTDLYQQNLLPKEVLTQGHRRAIELFQAGELALLSTGAEFLPTIQTNAANIARVTDSAPQITGDTGKKNVAVMNLVIPAKSDVPEAALKFALYLTNDRNQLSFAKLAGVLPSTVAALKDSYFTNTAGKVPTPEDRARSVSAAQMNQAEVLIPALDGIKELQAIVYDNLQAAMLGQKTVDQAVAEAAAAWDGR